MQTLYQNWNDRLLQPHTIICASFPLKFFLIHFNFWSSFKFTEKLSRKYIKVPTHTHEQLPYYQNPTPGLHLLSSMNLH